MIEIIRTPADMRARADELRGAGRVIGVVPTMGALHDGHLSLVRAAASRADDVVLTLFVNPTQFGPNEDLDAYPRQESRDLDLAEAAGATLAFCPEASAMYPEDHQTTVEVGALSQPMCGAGRPGHFRGVTTIVTKLFNITKPHVAVFGEKDFQQLAIIRRMNRDLDFGVDIIGAPIVREPDGLAMSSRNAYLSETERQIAPTLHRGLLTAADAFGHGERDAAALIAVARAVMHADLHIEYLDVRDASSLAPLATIDRPAVIAVAARIGTTRLIDNLGLRS